MARKQQLGTLMIALFGAALVLLGLAPQVQGAPEEEEEEQDYSTEPQLSAEKAQKVEEGKAELARKEKTDEQPQSERKIDEDPEGNPYVAGELIVTYEEQISASAQEQAKQRIRAQADKKIPKANIEVLSVAEIKDEPSKQEREKLLESKKQELENTTGVKYVDYNYVRKLQFVPNDRYFPLQWGLQRIRANEAWDIAAGRNAIIAIIDGGAYKKHSDLRRAWLLQFNYWNNISKPIDETGHGTHVAGIAGAKTHNKKGIAGTSPLSPLFNFDVCGTQAQGCDDGDIIEATFDATDFGADVINLSLSGPGFSAAGQAAVDYAWNNGVVVVAAAGNEATSVPQFPAAYANAIAVSGTDFFNGDSNFSNFGTWVDVAAPGGETGAPASEQILSSVPKYLNKAKYEFKNGTSMASPFVAGVAALLRSQGWNAADTRTIIELTATDLGLPGRDPLFGGGLVDAFTAVNLVNSTGAASDAAPDAARSQELSESSSITPTKKEAAAKKEE